MELGVYAAAKGRVGLVRWLGLGLGAGLVVRVREKRVGWWQQQGRGAVLWD